MAAQLHVATKVVEKHEKELTTVKKSICEMEAFYKVRLEKARLADMEKFYKEKLQEERSAHEKTKEEYESFKDRVAGEVDLALKTGNSENMNNPVNETRLKEMYEELRKDWAKIKPFVQTDYRDPAEIQQCTQENFERAAGKMLYKKAQIASAFNLDDFQASEKVHEYTKLTLQNLQLAVYYSFKGTVAQGFHGQEGETPGDSLNNFLWKCRCLSSLLILNNPPLQPDWINHHPDYDAWKFFPQDICAVSLK